MGGTGTRLVEDKPRSSGYTKSLLYLIDISTRADSGLLTISYLDSMAC